MTTLKRGKRSTHGPRNSGRGSKNASSRGRLASGAMEAQAPALASGLAWREERWGVAEWVTSPARSGAP